MRDGLRNALLVVLLGMFLAGPASSTERAIQHEYFEPDEAEDLLLNATTLDGSLPAAIDTPSGIVPAPEVSHSSLSPEKAYGGTSTPDSSDAAYRIDRNTTQPATVGYDDPFNPSVAPFKRLYAYDAVTSRLELTVADRQLRPLTIGGAAASGEDQFYGVLVVDLASNTPVRIPSVGPGTRILSAQMEPPVPFQILRDGAENWFVRSPETKRVRCTVLLVAPRAAFGSEYPDVGYEDLPQVASLPPALKQATQRVAERIGVRSTMRPRQVLVSLVEYFRGFAPSTHLPAAEQPVALYEELAVTRKGVCRHRAYAFLLTALSLGLPTRMIRNEAHAWVEVSDGSLWHRIDLGGAADQVELSGGQGAFQHVVPPDPYPWPAAAAPGSTMVTRARSGRSTMRLGQGPRRLDPLRPGGDSASPREGVEDRRPAAEITVSTETTDVRRGDPLSVSGSVQAEGRPCAGTRVDVGLVSGGEPVIPLGSLPTDSQGRFAGAVTVRLDLAVGDYSLVVTTPGSIRCGPGRAP